MSFSGGGCGGAPVAPFESPTAEEEEEEEELKHDLLRAAPGAAMGTSMGTSMGGEESLLSKPRVAALAAGLPSRLRRAPWRLLYCTHRDGISMANRAEINSGVFVKRWRPSKTHAHV